MGTAGGAAGVLPWQQGLRGWGHPQGLSPVYGGDSAVTGLRRHESGRVSDTTSLEPNVTPWW